jgi:hypothetical protein
MPPLYGDGIGALAHGCGTRGNRKKPAMIGETMILRDVV